MSSGVGYTRKSGCPTYNFSLVICRNADGKYLAVNETKNRGWWLPGGWVDPGESFVEAAVRETKEEGGIDIKVKGVLRMEHSHDAFGARLRAILYAEPIDESQPPKRVADKESLEARFVSLEELQSIGKLRGQELVEWAKYLESGGPIYPPSLLTEEDAPVEIPTTFNLSKLKKEY